MDGTSKNKPTILCIDDDQRFRDVVKGFFSEQGYAVIAAPDGEPGIALFRERHPDIILVDLYMPGVDGFRVLETVTGESPETPIIVISGEGRMDDVITALRLGAWNYLSKPVEKLAIISYAVNEALGKAALIRENKAHQQNLEFEVADRTSKLRNTLQALRHNEKKLCAIIENFPGFVCLCNARCRIEYVSPTLARHLGRDVLGEPCHTALFGAKGLCPWQGRETAGSAEPYEFRHPGDKRWYRVIHSSFTDSGGAVVERQLIFHDITAEKETLLELQAREAQLRAENLRLKADMTARYRFGEIIGKSPAMQKVYSLILQAAASDAGVIIHGESGTGKELVAKAIHQNSRRADKPLICVNCGAIPENLVESEFFGYVKGAFTGAVRDKRGLLDLASGGTLFLDEIGEISLSMQVKLLRAIEGGGYTPVGGERAKHSDVRIIAATSRDLQELVKKGAMRKDFFFRIQVVPIVLPPLRERREDIPLLVGHFFSLHGGEKVPPLNGHALAALMDHHWPGNVRELHNCILRYLSLGTLDLLSVNLDTKKPTTSPAMALEFGDGNRTFRELLEKTEKVIIASTLERTGWNKSQAATTLAIDYKTLTKKINQFGLAKPESPAK